MDRTVVTRNDLLLAIGELYVENRVLAAKVAQSIASSREDEKRTPHGEADREG
jgi:hypothetical protein